jgi:hypothetical protein
MNHQNHRAISILRPPFTPVKEEVAIRKTQSNWIVIQGKLVLEP